MSDAPDPSSAIALVGLRCVGKTSVGRALARRLDAEFVDLDEALVALWLVERGPGGGDRAGDGAAAPRAGDLLARLGPQAFRELELAALGKVLTRSGPQRLVLATGGGCVETAGARELLVRTTVVWLREDPALLAGRLAADPCPRPSLTGADPGAELVALARQREPLYAALAAVSIDCAGAGVESVVQRVLAALRGLE